MNRNLAEQVEAFAPEEVVLPHVHDDIEMSGGAAGTAGLALALQPQLLARRDSGGNLHRDLALVSDPPGSPAAQTRIRDGPARAATLWTRAGDDQEAPLCPDLAGAVAPRAHGWRAAVGRAGTGAGLAALLAGDLDCRLHALRRFPERDFEVVAQIGAALRAAAPAAAEQIAEAEHVAEDVSEIPSELVE